MMWEMITYPWPPKYYGGPIAVLCSGGLDSAILLGEAIRVYPVVHPIYVRVGTVWEATEQQYLQRFLSAVKEQGIQRPLLKTATSTIGKSSLQPLVVLDQPCGDLYAEHWSVTGRGYPKADDPEEDSYLPGRNALLFVKPLLWCLSRGIQSLFTAPLATNPFPDATPEYYESLARLIGAGVNGKVIIERPYAALGLFKLDVLRRGAGMPLELTFSCIRPIRGLHCGKCSKCGERRQGFKAAAMTDPTTYSDEPRTK